MLALDLDTVRTGALAALVVLAVLALVAMKVLRSVAQKVIGVVALAVVAGLVWSQRAALDDCAASLGESASDGTAVTCTFFGLDVDVDLPDL